MSANRPFIYVRTNHSHFLAELCDFVRFPSVSAQPQHAGEVKCCAAWLASHLRRIGLERVQVSPTPRHPIVTAEWRHAPGRPTVLIYGHYDVQPTDPLAEWRTPPFEPVVRDNKLYGRGSSDDKG
jgi:acetylornithine deacetylase/succinyl-diaminopimelate desuccinylase-like protein